jgi:CheY-like chemotaxis protein
MQPRVIDVNSIILHLEKMLRRLIGEDVSLRTELTPRIGSVLADPSQIEQVIVNLVVNARDAMPNGGDLLIKTESVIIDSAAAADQQLSKEGPYIVISVVDNGVGIQEEARPHVFEPFYTTREIGKGTGLGLSTVYGIVKQSDGFIELETEPGRGTTFSVYLPIVEVEADRFIRSIDEPANPQASETILLIEDEDVVRAVIYELLQSLGYKVFVAATPDEAISTCLDHDGSIDMIVADVIMPEMSGPELAKKLLEFRPEMKVLYLSGYADTALDHHGILAQDINFLQKPFTHDALAQKVREVLKRIEPAEA